MPHRPTTPPDSPTVDPLGAIAAQGFAPCPDSRHVDLVWRDPQTGERLILRLDASPALIDCLRGDGFEIVIDPPEDGRPDGFAAA